MALGGTVYTRRAARAFAASLAAMSMAALLMFAPVGGPVRAGIAAANPVLDWLNAAAEANGAHVILDGDTVRVTDPTPDDPPVTEPVADLHELQVYNLPTVPSWLSSCDASWTICSARGRQEAWDPTQPGMLFLGRVGAPFSGLGDREGHIGVFLALDEFPLQQLPDKAWTGSSHLAMARLMGTTRESYEWGVSVDPFDGPYANSHPGIHQPRRALLRRPGPDRNRPAEDADGVHGLWVRGRRSARLRRHRLNRRAPDPDRNAGFDDVRRGGWTHHGAHRDDTALRDRGAADHLDARTCGHASGDTDAGWDIDRSSRWDRSDPPDPPRRDPAPGADLHLLLATTRPRFEAPRARCTNAAPIDAATRAASPARA